MKISYLSVLLLGLAACADNPPSNPSARSESWVDYRAKIAQERDRGQLTPMQAEDKIEAKYRALHGEDPAIEGAFAYRRELYAQAQAGHMPANDAQALATARMNEVLARPEGESDFHDWLEQRFPPEPSD